MTRELKVALIQSSLVWENPEQNRNNFAEKINSISSEVDLIVLPEMFTSGFTMSPSNLDRAQGIITLEWMQEMAYQKSAALVGSVPFQENEHYTNRLFFVSPGGNFYQYDKRHTFTLAGEDKVYTAGSERLILDYKGFRICPMVCYDLRFPVWARNTENYDTLIYVANWPKPRVTAWDALLQARAIENLSYCIGVNRIGTDESGHQYSGHTSVYDPLGEQIAYSEKEEIIYTTLFKERINSIREKLKFLDDRDEFNLKS